MPHYELKPLDMANILTTLVDRQSCKYNDRAAVYRRNQLGQWLPLSWAELAAQVSDASYALEILGVKEQQKLAVFSPNDPDIIVTDLAAFANRAIPVSIYATSSEQQVEYIVRDSGASIIFTGNAEQYAIARRVAKRLPSLQRIVTYDTVTLEEGDNTTMTFEQLLALGKAATEACRAEVERRKNAAVPEDIATLLYTSGTTGDPKGAILPHSCFNAALEIHHRVLTSVSDADTSLCFLPLSHIFEKAWTYFCLDTGISVYVNANPKEIQTSMREVRPTCMCSVPRFWEKAYAVIQEKMAAMGPVNRFMCARALKIGRRRNLDYVRLGKKVPSWLEARYRFYDRSVFAKVRRVMGIEHGNIFPTAGAPLSAAITEFFRAIGVPIVIGYGLSETTATVSCFPYVGYEIGTVGTVLPGLEVKIGADNEILVKGPTVMRGYYNKTDETEAVFTEDGFFRTGDAGYFDESGALILTERIKDLFKTSNGKYIAPQALESRLGEDKYIEQVAVIGDNRKFVTAIIVPAIEAVKEYARKKKIQYRSLEELLKNSQVRDLISKRIDALQEGFASFEKIKKFTLLPKEFTMESGELTNTLKIRRPVINRHYASEIEAMYA
jgi:putative AMP binding long chain acyl-coA synthetase